MEVPRSWIGGEAPPAGDGGGTPTIGGPDPFWYFGANDPMERGNIDLWNRPIVIHPDNSWSTVRTMTVEENGRHINLPTIGPKGEDWSDDEAYEHYRRTGQHLGIYATRDAAGWAAEQLHNEQADFYNERAQRLRAPAPVPGSIESAPLGRSYVTPVPAERRSDIGRSGYVTASGRPKVSYAGVNPDMLSAANSVGLRLGRPLEITSARDSVHSKNSHHYGGNALDIRNRNMSPAQQAEAIAELKAHGFKVLLEKDHIHVSMVPGGHQYAQDASPVATKRNWYNPFSYWDKDDDEFKRSGFLADRLPENRFGPLADRLPEVYDRTGPLADQTPLTYSREGPLADRTPAIPGQLAHADLRPPRWVTQAEVQAFKQSDASYGSINAMLLTKGPVFLWQFLNQKQADSWLRSLMTTATKKSDEKFLPKFLELSAERKDQITEAFVASQRSPVATLGFDVRQMISTVEKSTTNAFLAGVYDPLTDNPGNEKRASTDRMWFKSGGWSNNEVSTPVHESIHRGVQKLRNAGKFKGIPLLEYSEYDPEFNEMLDRAIMIKNFGYVELAFGGPRGWFAGDDQMYAARDFLNTKQGAEIIETIERLAAEQLAEEKRRGPR